MSQKNSYLKYLSTALIASALGSYTLYAQVAHVSEPAAQESGRSPQTGSFVVPESSKPTVPGFAHTNYVIHSLDGRTPARVSPDQPAVSGPDATEEILETPASMGCLYVGSPAISGCTSSGIGQKGGPSSAGYGAIAIVDAYDNPDAASDLATFDSEFGLAAASFTKIYANGNGSCTTPPENAGWALEESLDIEWAHVFAPKAAIVLVEACSNSNTDLYYAEQVAFNYIVDNYSSTGGQVTNSWAGGEYSGETANDIYFSDLEYAGGTGFTSHVLAFASAGDSGSAANYPSVVPWLISAGGTSVIRSSANGHFSSEACWSGSGGGESQYETYQTSWTGGNVGPWADYQYPIYGQTNRRVPDISFNADPSSGVAVYSGVNGGWYEVGGTSVSSPSLASIVNRTGNELSSYHIYPIVGEGYFTAGEHNLIYSEAAANKQYAAAFYDVTTGSNGNSAVKNYDLCTGVGSPRGTTGK